jgi:hypothetical protein
MQADNPSGALGSPAFCPYLRVFGVGACGPGTCAVTHAAQPVKDPRVTTWHFQPEVPSKLLSTSYMQPVSLFFKPPLATMSGCYWFQAHYCCTHTVHHGPPLLRAFGLCCILMFCGDLWMVAVEAMCLVHCVMACYAGGIMVPACFSVWCFEGWRWGL